MTTPKANPISTDKQRAYIDARLKQCRMLSEEITSAPAHPNTEAKQIQVKNDTSSQFSIGVDHQTRPNQLMVEIAYKVHVKVAETDMQVANYEAKHQAYFSVSSWTGFEDWTNVPPLAVAPYFTFVATLAIRRAEGTFAAVGLRGLSLPLPPAGEVESLTAADGEPAALAEGNV